MIKGKTPPLQGQPQHGAFVRKVDNRGRITLPKAVRKHMRLEPGDRVEFTFHSLGDTRVGSVVPDHYYAVLKRLDVAVPRARS